jgi:hypothetical protein
VSFLSQYRIKAVTDAFDNIKVGFRIGLQIEMFGNKLRGWPKMIAGKESPVKISETGIISRIFSGKR